MHIFGSKFIGHILDFDLSNSLVDDIIDDIMLMFCLYRSDSEISHGFVPI